MNIFYAIHTKLFFSIMLILSFVYTSASSQTPPSPQVVPYSQNFASLDGTTSIAYPVGIQGWTVSQSAPTVDGRTDAPIADRGLFANGSASSTGAGIYGFNGKIGLLCNNTTTLAIALSLNTFNVAVTERVRVKFDGMVIRNVTGTAGNNIMSALILQYRIGNSGNFKNVGSSAVNTTTVQTTGTNGINIVNSNFLLPEDASHQAVVQLRWTVKDVSGSIGDRPSFAIDNIDVTADGSIAPPLFKGYKITTRNITLSNNSTTYATNMLDGVTRTQKLDEYGGASTDFIGNTTGYFKTYKDARNVWHLVDPAGYKFYSIGINTIVPQQSGVDPQNLIKSIYANTIGNFSDTSYTNMPYCVRLNLGYTFRTTTTERKALYDNGVTPLFDADFITYCEQVVNSEITQARINDKNLLGYFSDNELPIANPFNSKLIDKWLDVNNYGGATAASTNPNYIAVTNWLKARHGGTLVSPNSADDAEWPGFLADHYYKICRDVIKAKDPNHLFIGSRLHQDLANRYQFEAAGKYVDVLSVNNYNVWSKAQLDARYDVWEQYTGKPFMVTEYYAQGDDAGLPNSSGAGFNVKTQQDRADFFEHYTMEMLKRKWNVGFQYFKLNDDPGKNNKGLIDVNGNFWQPMKTSFTKIAQDIYDLRKFLIFGEQTIDVPTGIINFKKVKADFSIKLYPNPSAANVNIEVDNFKAKTARVKVYDLSGKTVHQEFLTTSTFNNKYSLNIQSSLKPGIYIVELSGNGASVQEKLVVY